MLIVDSFDSLTLGLDTKPLDLLDFVNTMPMKHAIMFNRDLLSP